MAKAEKASTALVFAFIFTVAAVAAPIETNIQLYVNGGYHMSYIGDDYLLSFEYGVAGNGDVSGFDTASIWNNARLGKFRLYNCTVARLGFLFTDCGGGVGSHSPYNATKLDEVLDRLASVGVKAVIDLHNTVECAGYFGTQSMLDNWVALATTFAGDSRIAGFNVFNEPNAGTWAAADLTAVGEINSIAKVHEFLALLIDSIRAVDATRTIYYPVFVGMGAAFQAAYGSMAEWDMDQFYTDLGTAGVLADGNIVYDIVHPYYTEDANDIVVGDPIASGTWFGNNLLADAVAKFGASACWIGETFPWSVGEGYTKAEQEAFQIAFLTQCISLGVGVQEWCYFTRASANSYDSYDVVLSAVVSPQIYAGPSSYPRTTGGTYSTAIIDDVIDYMDTNGLNIYRMSIYYTVAESARNDMVGYFLANCDYDLIVCRHVYNPGGGLLSGDSWAEVQNWVLSLCSAFSDYAGRLWVEFENEYGSSDLATQCQIIVTAVRNAGYTHRLVANKWTQTWSSMAGITDPLDEFYSGMHFYFNSWSPAGAETQMNYALAAGVKVINTEIGADSAEEGSFSSSEVQEVNDFMAWCADSEHRIVGNCVWMRYGLQNADTYTSMGLDWPYIPDLPESPPVTYTITAGDDANSTIAPTGAVTVSSNANQTFTFTPDGGFIIDSVTVDTVSVPVAASYTFLNVTANHTIDITAAAGAPAGGSIAAIVVSRMLFGG